MNTFSVIILLVLCGVFFIGALMKNENPPHTAPTLQPQPWEVAQTLDTIRPRHKPAGAAYMEQFRLEREKADQRRQFLAQQELKRELTTKNIQHQTATSSGMKAERSVYVRLDPKTQARLDAAAAETRRKFQPEMARINAERDRMYQREIARIDAELDRMMWSNIVPQGGYGYNYGNHRKLQNLITDMEMHYMIHGNSGLQHSIPYTLPYGYAW